jgi:hypothetical protein
MEGSLKRISVRGKMNLCLICIKNSFKNNNINNDESKLINKIIREFFKSDNYNLSDWEESANNIQPINILDNKFDINDLSFEHKIVLKLKVIYKHISSILNRNNRLYLECWFKSFIW